jgi:predicted nucleotidyltransferase
LTTPEQLREALSLRNFPYPQEVIHLFAAGSNQHGARIEGKSDLDVAGIYIPPPFVALGVDTEEHFVTSTGKDNEKNTASDVDLQMYSLRRWAYLATAKGNPNTISFLFMPATRGTVWERYILPHRTLFLARTHATHFVGYGRAQLFRMQGLRGSGRHGQREDAKGYDTKAAMHMIRLMGECLELLRDGRITYPRPEAELLLEIREGKWEFDDVVAWYNTLEGLVLAAEMTSGLPQKINRALVSEIVSDAYMSHWTSGHAFPWRTGRMNEQANV